MKNKEKFPNVDDALKAFKKHKECGCNCSFDEWLDTDEDKHKAALRGLLVTAMMRTIFGGSPKEALDTDDADDNGDITGVECPICHGKNGRIDGFISPSFVCDECNVHIHKWNSLHNETTDDFKSFVADLCKKNKKA